MLRRASSSVVTPSLRLDLLLENVRTAASLGRLGIRPGKHPAQTQLTATALELRDLERGLWLQVDGGETETTVDALSTRYPAAKSLIRTLAQPDPFASVTESGLAATRFERCYCCGPAFAKRWAALGLKTVTEALVLDSSEELMPASQRVLNLTHAQRIGLTKNADMEQFIHRAECEQWSAELQRQSQSVDPKIEGEVLGSFRRGEAVSSDIDFVIRHPEYHSNLITSYSKVASTLQLGAIVEKLTREGIWQVGLAHGAKVWRGLGRLPSSPFLRRLDISIAPYEAFAARQLGSTGDTRLMKLMRTEAIKRGLLLNENGLWRNGVRVPTETEKDIFDALDLPYLEPTQRRWPLYRDAFRL